ncbi:winged helix-turn-helix domain-containing protein [Bradyrhizobium sp.]|uniref:winged helix-turn-helix domain-containing protein n=1 Tax=Bradyrhizobium sp. TaxID=376 RepID=UPI002CB101C4|nr:winged helix-turn-helix domain-containing protein [Bradyrhizobium sp.]HMM90635.1 winged helix-turn-helix domain-containing protein [Bradyrhizobium sp.]
MFEDYSFDTDRRELHRGAESVSVAPQVFDLLDYLIRNRQRVVSKDDLINAVWDGRVVSDAALTTRLNVVRAVIGDSGQEQRLIKTLPRKGFRFIGPVLELDTRESTSAAGRPAESHQPSLTLPDRPSIAVLPFQNMSGDPDQDYFADGMVDDIITALSRFKFLFVIARNSSFAYRGPAVDIKRVGRELGVRYVLEGSVRKDAGRVRIAGQLIDADTGAHVWADRFEGEFGDIFALQDEVTMNVIAAIRPKLLEVEIEHAVRQPNDLSAYDLYLRATPHYYSMTAEGAAEATRLLARALEIDPRYSVAASLAATCHILKLIHGWSADPQAEIGEVMRLSQLVLSIDENDPETLSAVGFAKAYISGDFAAAIEMVDRAVALNPNSSMAWGYRGTTCLIAGRPEDALQSLGRSMRLSPLDPMLYNLQAFMAVAFINLRRFDDAVAAAETALHKKPNFMLTHRCLVAALAHLGRHSEAKQAAVRLLEHEPDFRMSIWADRTRQWPTALLAEGLRKAGLPE